MTRIQIDTSKMPLRSWTIAGSARVSPRAVTSALTKPARVQTESPRASDANVIGSSNPTLDERLFDQKANLKIQLSQLAMRLSPRMRSAIFDQLDVILDRDSWQDNSALIQPDTFMTFLRFIVFAFALPAASLGVGPTGHLLAAWSTGTPRITAEFLSNDKAAAVVVKHGTRSSEIMTWRGHVVDLKLFVEREGLIECFVDRDDKA